MYDNLRWVVYHPKYIILQHLFIHFLKEYQYILTLNINIHGNYLFYAIWLWTTFPQFPTVDIIHEQLNCNHYSHKKQHKSFFFNVLIAFSYSVIYFCFYVFWFDPSHILYNSSLFLLSFHLPKILSFNFSFIQLFQ